MPADQQSLKNAYGLWVVIGGFLVVLIVALFAINRWSDTKDVTAVVGSVTGVIGTLAGAYFGVHAGQASQDRAENQKDLAQKQVSRLAALLPAADAQRAMNIE